MSLHLGIRSVVNHDLLLVSKVIRLLLSLEKHVYQSFVLPVQLLYLFRLLFTMLLVLLLFPSIQLPLILDLPL